MRIACPGDRRNFPAAIDPEVHAAPERHLRQMAHLGPDADERGHDARREEAFRNTELPRTYSRPSFHSLLYRRISWADLMK